MDINREFDLLAIAEQDTQLKKSPAGWYIGPCPFCGGEDRFNVRKMPDGWRWYCRHCGGGKYRTSADYLMRRDNLNYRDMLAKYNGNGHNSKWTERAKTMPAKNRFQEQLYPEQLWQTTSMEIVQRAEDNLWQPIGAPALAWLHKRGLSDETIRKYRLGYNPSDTRFDGALWGNPGTTVYYPRGVVIPHIAANGIYAVKIRLVNSQDRRKYIHLPGGKTTCYGWQNMRGAWLAIITEGEFDAIILDQAAGDLAAVCTFGAATNSPEHVDPDCIRWIINTAHIWLVFDNDEAGLTGATNYQARYPRVRIVHLPEQYHDINDAYVKGFDLADWVSRQAEQFNILGG
jgi:hypothetical protein